MYARLLRKGLQTSCLFSSWRRSRGERSNPNDYGIGEVDDLRSVFINMIQRVSEIVWENREMFDKISELENRHLSDMKDIQTLDNDNKDLSDKIRKLESELQTLCEKLIQIENDKKSLGEELADVKSDLRFTKEKADSVEEDNFTMEIKIEGFTQTIEELQDKLNNYRKVNSEMFFVRNEKRRLEKSLAKANTQINALECEIKGLQNDSLGELIEREIDLEFRSERNSEKLHLDIITDSGRDKQVVSTNGNLRDSGVICNSQATEQEFCNEEERMKK